MPIQTMIEIEVSLDPDSQTIITEPWASAQANIVALGKAYDATYRDVRFGRKLQRELGYCGLKLFGLANWPEFRDAGGGSIAIDDDVLDEIIAQSEKIDALVANARPARPDYACAARRDGCNERVSTSGDLCEQCNHDQ